MLLIVSTRSAGFVHFFFLKIKRPLYVIFDTLIYVSLILWYIWMHDLVQE